jgi:type VI protein secretion system component Hcp
MIYLELIVRAEPILGDGTTPDYGGQIEIESFDWKMSAKHIYEGDDFIRTEMHPKCISLNKLVDPATPNLCKYLDERAQFSKATITMLTMAWVGKGSSHQRVMQLVLSDGYIEDLSIQASESGKAVALKEKLTLSYAKSTVLYFPFDAARRARGNMTTKFELIAKADR